MRIKIQSLQFDKDKYIHIGMSLKALFLFPLKLFKLNNQIEIKTNTKGSYVTIDYTNKKGVKNFYKLTTDFMSLIINF